MLVLNWLCFIASAIISSKTIVFVYECQYLLNISDQDFDETMWLYPHYLFTSVDFVILWTKALIKLKVIVHGFETQ